MEFKDESRDPLQGYLKFVSTSTRNVLGYSILEHEFSSNIINYSLIAQYLFLSNKSARSFSKQE